MEGIAEIAVDNGNGPIVTKLKLKLASFGAFCELILLQ